jgi:8-oxo-dGTP pyrophosphatase MutT (NUDIX family)
MDASAASGALEPRPWSDGRVRPIAIAVVWRDDCLLVVDAYDASKDETFYRPLGGGIEFGEYGRDTIIREMREEIGAELRDISYLGTLENVFIYERRRGHELVLVYEATLADAAIYTAEELVAQEDNGARFKVVWKPLSFFHSGAAPLYPSGLLELLTSRRTGAG